VKRPYRWSSQEQLGGALIGAVIGTAIPKWRLRYTRGLPVRAALRSLPRGRLGLGLAYTVGW